MAPSPVQSYGFGDDYFAHAGAELFDVDTRGTHTTATAVADPKARGDPSKLLRELRTPRCAASVRAQDIPTETVPVTGRKPTESRWTTKEGRRKR